MAVHKVNFNLTFIEQNSFIFINAPTTQAAKTQEANINKCQAEETKRERERERERGANEMENSKKTKRKYRHNK